MAGLKKETKKLTKTLKSHRKRLESLLSAQATLMAPTGAAAAPQLSPAELHAVLSEIAQLQTALAAVRNQQWQMASMVSDCSSDSDSDCEEGPKQRRRMDMKLQQVQQLQGLQQLQAGSTSQTCAQQNVATAVAASMAPVADSGSGMTSVVLQVPLIDQEQPVLCQQLPPPQQYATTGRVLVCQGKACMRKGALQVLQAVSHATAASLGVEVLPCKCLGKCKQGPAMRVRTEQQQRSSLITEIEPLEVPEVLDQLLG
jgi:(2Fe-2S) ferredoxin